MQILLLGDLSITTLCQKWKQSTKLLCLMINNGCSFMMILKLFDCVKGVFKGSGLIDQEQTFEMFSKVSSTRQTLWL